MKTFYQEQTEALGVTPENNRVKSWYINGHRIKDENQPGRDECEIFTEDEEGNLCIQYFTLHGVKRNYRRGNNKWPNDYQSKRLKVPKIRKDGSIAKYDNPAGASLFPWYGQNIIDKFQRKEKIKTLVLTEGAKKAFKGEQHGLDIIGLGSITAYKDKNTGAMHSDVLDVIKSCQVEHVIWLMDGDCRDLSKHWPEDENKDLYKRPNSFFHSARNIKKLLADHAVNLFFMHPKSDEIANNPKGLDDLYISQIKLAVEEEQASAAYKKKDKAARQEAKEQAAKDAAIELTADITAISRPPKYFKRIDITGGISKLADYFHLKDINAFYNFYHQQIGDKKFLFNGTWYQWDGEKQELQIKIPAAAKNYVRVGDHYYEKIKVPDVFGNLNDVLDLRLKSTINDDYGKNFLQHVLKLKRFVVIPSHDNYQHIIRNCYNRYHPFEHLPMETDAKAEELMEQVPESIAMVKHIFGTKKVKHTCPETGEKITYEEWQLGLDYMQLLYLEPVEKLPILCLVSKENKTGKTTFANWLKHIFTQNMAIVGNADLANDFNAFWADKLLICCDESKIDKQVVVEKLKNLSTADKIVVNQKGRDHMELDFFGKFIMLTNHEDNFITVTQDDTRYWVRKVSPIQERKIDMKQKLIDEIPAFLAFLGKRKLATRKEDRMWFAENLIKTDALKTLIENTSPSVIRQVRAAIKDMFLDFGVEEILMSTKEVDAELFSNKYRSDHAYLNRMLTNELKLERYKNEDGEEVSKRYRYPKIVTTYNEGVSTQEIGWTSSVGRPWVFKREDFVTEEESKRVRLEEGIKADIEIGTYEQKKQLQLEEKPPF